MFRVDSISHKEISLFERNSCSNKRRQTNSAFTIDTRLELLGVAWPINRAGLMYNLQPAKKGGSGGGVSAASPMPKLVSFL